MQLGLIQHYIAEFLDEYLKELSQKFPMSPLSSVITNYLYMSDDGTENSRLKIYAANLYNTIKQLEDLPDEVAFVTSEEVIEEVRPGLYIHSTPVANPIHVSGLDQMKIPEIVLSDGFLESAQQDIDSGKP